ncbi:class I SAM-dependent methyltransferase [Aureimonas sp. AU22]|uniref:class I SAM-dependent methyltransferase n=1 Tax=Aureimonas sp. AU22 TaxID=1638162 RepID=UPI0023792EDA|nr:class I SAM-dependent methyltransferase [Aureimonas sp. AU22]
MRRLLQDAGLRPSMRVLDAGCGSGDVTLIAAELVGSAGHVVGIDRSVGVVHAARERASAAGVGNVTFETRDIDDPPEGPFDAVVGRRVLMYHPDPVRAVRGLAAALREGGIAAFHEHAAVEPLSGDGLMLHRTAQGWLHETIRREDGNGRIGMELHAVLTQAGLNVVEVRAEAVVQTPTQHYALASIVGAVLPRIVERGVATADEIDIGTLEARLDAERIASGSTYVADMMFGAWGQKR